MNKRKRLHPLWIGYELLIVMKDVIAPIVIAGALYLQGHALWSLIALIGMFIFICYQIIGIIFSWKNYYYVVNEHELEINEGRFITKKRFIPLTRIISYEQKTSFYHKFFKLTSLELLTATTNIDEATIRLPMLTADEAHEIIGRLEKETNHKNCEERIEHKELAYYRMKPVEIFYYVITSLYIVIGLPIISSLITKIDDLMPLEGVVLTLIKRLITSPVSLVISILVAFIVTVIISFFIVYFRHGNFTVTADEKRLHISKGILTTSTFTIQKDNINGIIIERSFPRRLFSIVSVKAVTQGDMLEEDEIKKQILFPFIRESRAIAILDEMLPNYPVAKKMCSVSKEALFLHMIHPSYLFVIIIFFVFYFGPEYWFIPIIYGIGLIILRIIKAKQTKYLYEDDILQLQSGVLTTNVTMTAWEKIDELTVSQTYLEKKLYVATIIFTIREKPTYNVMIEHIPIADALQMLTQYREKTEHLTR